MKNAPSISEPFPKQSKLKDFFKPKPPTSSSQEDKKENKKDERLKVIVHGKEREYFPQVPGLSLTKNFITQAEEDYLWKEVNKLPWNTSLKRRKQTHGMTSDKETHTILEYLGELPSCTKFLTERLVDEGLLDEPPVQCGINEYEPGQGIGPHIDRVIFGNQVIMVSLGSDIVMDFHGPKEEKFSVLLPRRSAVLAEGDARFKWKHGIANRKSDKLSDGTILKRGKRISLTFRYVDKTAPRRNHISLTEGNKDKAVAVDY